MIDLCVYTHRYSDYLPICLESIAKTVRDRPYRLNVLIQPGNVHENMQKVLDMTQSDIVCYIDEDVEFLQPGWIDCMLESLEHPEIGMVGTAQVKKDDEKWSYLTQIDEDSKASEKENRSYTVTWVPAHVIMLDRRKVKDLHIATDMPGSKGMSDVDICMQVRSQGFQIVLDERVVVYHPWKPDVENPAASQFPEQVVYMLKKWGDLYASFLPVYREPEQSIIERLAEEAGVKHLLPTRESKATAG